MLRQYSQKQQTTIRFIEQQPIPPPSKRMHHMKIGDVFKTEDGKVMSCFRLY